MSAKQIKLDLLRDITCISPQNCYVVILIEKYIILILYDYDYIYIYTQRHYHTNTQILLLSYTCTWNPIVLIHLGTFFQEDSSVSLKTR